MGAPMTKGMNWRKAKLASRPYLDHRWEFTEFKRDRADRWIAAVERRRREQRHVTPSVRASS
jgi:hypothetical protein